MSEKIYASVLHLLAPHFHRIYGDEATQLFRDRCRDEQGLGGKIRLWLDLLSDLAVCIIQDHRFAREMRRSQLAAANALNRMPSFDLVRTGPPRTLALFLGGTFSLGILATLSTLVGHGGGTLATKHAFLERLQYPVSNRMVFTSSYIQPEIRPVNAHPIGSSGLGMRLGYTPVRFEAVALNLDEKKRIIDGAITNLREYYVYPNVARKMIDALLAHERNGDYENEKDGADFAATITRHLQDVSHDRHLRVIYSAEEMPDRPLGPPEADPNFRSRIQRENCTFRKVEVLPHNIGYIKFDAFGPVGLCRDTAAAAMQFLAHVDALIFDLRENHGGDPHMVSFMASYLFNRRTHLNDIYTPRDKSTEEFWTAENVAGSKFDKKPVYILTSAVTFSGAEEFTYDLKNLKRAVVVGETTGGGAHLVMLHRIDAHFTIGVPFARPINPVSKTDWERTGVVPDVKVKSADALATAEQLGERKLKAKPE